MTGCRPGEAAKIFSELNSIPCLKTITVREAQLLALGSGVQPPTKYTKEITGKFRLRLGGFDYKTGKEGSMLMMILPEALKDLVGDIVQERKRGKAWHETPFIDSRTIGT